VRVVVAVVDDEVVADGEAVVAKIAAKKAKHDYMV
jgi:hypothetical protein